MRRTSLALFVVVPLLVCSGCALREPRYSSELGGFPMYKGSASDRARMYQGVSYSDDHEQLNRKSQHNAHS
jgi:hypothetical protein